MLKITKDVESGMSLKQLGYISGRGPIGRMILRITRWLRAVNAEKYMRPAKRHLDIGCGDGYFLRRSKCEERFGLDKLLGDEIKGKLDFPNSYFDYVTMLAVIEHVSDPKAVLVEIARVLKPNGKLIITTPKESTEIISKLYAKIGKEHESYFNFDRIRRLTEGTFEIVGQHTFSFNLNQAFCLKKKQKKI